MEKIIEFQNIKEAQTLFGSNDENIKAVEHEFKVSVFSRGSQLKIKGPSRGVEKAVSFLEYILEAIRSGQDEIGRKDLFYIMKEFKSRGAKDEALPREIMRHQAAKKQVGPKTKGQREYIDAIRKYDMVFGIGPAGTGKTYLAMAMAVETSLAS